MNLKDLILYGKKDKSKDIIIFALSITIVLLLIVFITKPISLEKKEVTKKSIINVDYTNYNLCLEQIKKHERPRYDERPYKENGRWYVGYGFATTDSINKMSQMVADSLLVLMFNDNITFVNSIYEFDGNKALAVSLLTYRWGGYNLIHSKLHNALISNDIVNIVREWNLINFQGKKHKKIEQRNEWELNLFIN